MSQRKSTKTSSTSSNAKPQAAAAAAAKGRGASHARSAEKQSARPTAPKSKPSVTGIEKADAVAPVKPAVAKSAAHPKDAVAEAKSAPPAAPKAVAAPAVAKADPAIAAVKPVPVVPVAKSVAAAPAAKPAAKSSTQRHGFRTGEYCVYPAHGVGQIVAIEEQEVAGFKLELFVVHFVKDKMTLRVPTSKVTSVGMRKLAEPNVVKRALDTLTGRARIKRTMWSRRAQEYEAKINSGDLIAIAEVVRDLYRSDAQPEQSYSERQLYEAALDRMARELAVVQKLTEAESLKLIESQLQRGPRRGVKAEGDSDGETSVDEAGADAGIEEAA